MNIAVGLNDDVTLHSLVDTGATISAINPKVLPLILPNIHRRNRISPISINLSVGDNETMPLVEEEIEALISINNKPFLWRFFVVPSLSTDMIIGMDWLIAYDILIHCKDFSITFGIDLGSDVKSVPSEANSNKGTHKHTDVQVQQPGTFNIPNTTSNTAVQVEPRLLMSRVENPKTKDLTIRLSAPFMKSMPFANFT